MSGSSHIPSVKCLKVILELYLYCLLPSQQMTLEFYLWIKISIRVKTNHLFSLLDSFILYKVILLLSRLDLEERSKNKRLNLISKSSMSQLLLEGAKFKTPQDCLWHLLSLPLGLVQVLSKSKAIQITSCAARPNIPTFHRTPKLNLPSVVLEGKV